MATWATLAPLSVTVHASCGSVFLEDPGRPLREHVSGVTAFSGCPSPLTLTVKNSLAPLKGKIDAIVTKGALTRLAHTGMRFAGSARCQCGQLGFRYSSDERTACDRCATGG